jgi:hypothetical protein
LAENSFEVLETQWDSSSRLKKVGKCNMLMEKVSVAFSVLMISFMPGMQRIHG